MWWLSDHFTGNVSTSSRIYLILLADFLKRFGVATDQTEIGYAIPPDWQSALSNGSSAGGIIGLLVSEQRGLNELSLIATVQRMGGRQVWSQNRHASFYYRFVWFHLHHGVRQLAWHACR